MTIFEWLTSVRIDKSAFLIPLDVVAALLFVILLAKSLRPSWLVRAAALIVVGGGLGLLLFWLVSDVWVTFGLALTPVVGLWVVLAFAGVFLAVGNVWRSRWWRKAVAVASVAVFLLTAAAGINVDFGAYRTLDEAAGIMPYGALPAADLDGHAAAIDTAQLTSWRAPAGMPKHGVVGTVSIPATVSHFSARAASVYLPPAALVADPPVLPVLVIFSGQPGGPSDMFTSGRVQDTLNAYAAKHQGLAPIVVAPDQLGHPGQNPMCVDSPLGNSATYLTVDVPKWIRTHLTVSDAAQYWAVGGYSQGGTCATQFGFGHPALFGALIDILGEKIPTIGASTVGRAFGGSFAAYDAQKPLAILAAHGSYPGDYGIFGTGLQDKKYTGYVHAAYRAATAAGMTTMLIDAPASGHDWNTVRYVLARALPALAHHWGLGT